MATNFNKPLRSAAIEENEEKSAKKKIRPDEVEENAKGKAVVVSNTNIVEQGKNAKIDISKMSDEEQDTDFTVGLLMVATQVLTQSVQEKLEAESEDQFLAKAEVTKTGPISPPTRPQNTNQGEGGGGYPGCGGSVSSPAKQMAEVEEQPGRAPSTSHGSSQQINKVLSSGTMTCKNSHAGGGGG